MWLLFKFMGPRPRVMISVAGLGLIFQESVLPITQSLSPTSPRSKRGEIFLGKKNEEQIFTSGYSSKESAIGAYMGKKKNVCIYIYIMQF